MTETINRLTELMDTHWDAKSHMELTHEENEEIRFLLRRLQDLQVLKRAAPKQFKALVITEKEVMIMNNYVDWLKSIGDIDED